MLFFIRTAVNVTYFVNSINHIIYGIYMIQFISFIALDVDKLHGNQQN